MFNRKRCTQLFSEGIRQHLQAIIKRKLGGAILGDFATPLAFARTEDLALDQGSVAGLQIAQFGKGLRHRKPVGIARINPRHKRIDGMVQKFLSQPAHDKLSHCFLFSVASPGHKRLAQHRQLGAGREKFGGEKSQRRSRHGDRSLVSNDVTGAGARIGIHASGLQAGVLHQLRNLRGRFQEGIRPELGQEAILPQGLNHAAHA